MTAILANWIASAYAVRSIETVLRIIERRGGNLHPTFWGLIAENVRRSAANIQPRDLFRWTATLLRTVQPACRVELLIYITVGLDLELHPDTGVAMFDFLSAPVALRVTTQPISLDAPVGTRASAAPGQSWRTLDTDWCASIYKLLPTRAAELEKICTHHLMLANILHSALPAEMRPGDPISGYRRGVDTLPSQDKLRRPMDIIIDTARDAGEWIVTNDPPAAVGLIRRWSTSGVVTLQRLAIHCAGIQTTLSPDLIVGWIIQNKWLYSLHLKHEVFRVMESFYPRLGTDIRKQLIDASATELKDDKYNSLDAQTRDYERYNLLYWLHTADPACDIVKFAFESWHMRHPEFQPRRTSRPEQLVFRSIGQYRGIPCGRRDCSARPQK